MSGSRKLGTEPQVQCLLTNRDISDPFQQTLEIQYVCYYCEEFDSSEPWLVEVRRWIPSMASKLSDCYYLLPAQKLLSQP